MCDCCTHNPQTRADCDRVKQIFAVPPNTYTPHTRADCDSAFAISSVCSKSLTIRTTRADCDRKIYKYVDCLYGFYVQDFSSRKENYLTRVYLPPQAGSYTHFLGLRTLSRPDIFVRIPHSFRVHLAFALYCCYYIIIRIICKVVLKK